MSKLQYSKHRNARIPKIYFRSIIHQVYNNDLLNLPTSRGQKSTNLPRNPSSWNVIGTSFLFLRRPAAVLAASGCSGFPSSSTEDAASRPYDRIEKFGAKFQPHFPDYLFVASRTLTRVRNPFQCNLLYPVDFDFQPFKLDAQTHIFPVWNSHFLNLVQTSPFFTGAEELWLYT